MWGWIKFEYNELGKITIPRWIEYQHNSIVKIHGFTDASDKAYWVVVYNRVIYNNEVKFTLLAANI